MHHQTMARFDAKTIGAAALVAAVGINLTTRGPSGTPNRPPLIRQADTPDTTTPIQMDLEREFAEQMRPYLERPNHAIRFLLATVPDPDSTTLRLYTDRTLDALILAAFHNGLFLVHHWIPWRHSLESLDSQYVQRKTQLIEFKERGRFPGLLIFEHTDEIWITFVVPEHPSAGVKRDVMRRAVRYVASPLSPVDLDADCEARTRAPLIHSTFTGSIESLDEWMDTDPCATKVVSRVVSGAVSGLTQPRRDPHSGVLTQVPYQWVRVQLADLRELTQQFLNATRPWGQSEIANLTEDSTGFGRSVGERDMTFPWQIHRVRNAMPDSGGEASGLFGLPLNLRDPRKPHGALPTFAPEQTPAVEEVVLAQITARMERMTSDYVFLTATDPLDLVFLSRLLRKANPGQRIIVNSPDMMLLRAHDMAPATGMLVPATFPISNHLLLKSETAKVFDCEVSASIFEAANDAIAKPERGDRGPLLNRSAWLMTLGRNGFWPVALLSPGDNRDARNDRLPLSAKAGFSLLLAASFAWLALLLAARFQWLRGAADFRVKPEWPGWTARAISLTRVTFVLSLLVAVCAMPLWFPRRQDSGWIWPLIFWLAMMAMTAAGFVPWARRRLRWRRLWPLTAMAAGPLAAVLLTLAAFYLLNPSDPYEILRFFLVRSQDYLNGVAPLLPVVLLLAGCVGCAWASHLAVVGTTERFVILGAPCLPPEIGRLRFQRRLALGAAIVSLLIVGAIWRPLHSIETYAYDLAYLGLVAVLLTATAYACFDMVSRWSALKRFLDRLEIHPIRFALNEMPWHGETEPIWESNPRRRSTVFYGRAMDCLRRLEVLGGGSAEVSSAITEIRRYLESRDRNGGEYRRDVEMRLAALAAQFGVDIDREDGPWRRGSADLVPSEPSSPQDRVKQEFLGIRLAAFLRSRFLVLRARLTAMIAGFVAVTLSLNSYCFGPERVIQAFSVFLLLVLGGAVVSVFRQLHNDPLLARMSGAKSGEFDWGFWGKMGSAAALPILSMLASYTPALGRFLGSWLQPALEAAGR